MLLVVGGHAGAHLLLAREAAYEYHHRHREGQRDEVVQVQSRALAVEDEEHHEGHEVHHELHAGHALRAGLLAHGVPRVEELHAEHQQAEQRDVVAVERYVEPEVEYRVIVRQVGAPQEGLLAQLDGYGEEHEHSRQERHLYQHRQAARHGAVARPLLQGHHLLLLLHGLLGLRVFLVEGVHLGLQYAHDGAALVALVHQRQQHQADEQREDDDDDAVVPAELLQEVEHRHYEVAADALGDDRPAQGQHAVVAAAYGAQVAQLRGAVVEAHVHLRSLLVILQAYHGAHVRQVVARCVAAVGLHLDVGVLEGDAALGGHDGCKILVFEGHPLKVGLHLLLLVLAQAQVVGVLVLGGLVVYAAVVTLAVAVAVALAAAAAVHLLLAQHAVLPLEVHVGRVAHHLAEAHEVDVEAHLVAVAAHGVAELQVRRRALQAAVALDLGPEAQRRGVVLADFQRAAGSLHRLAVHVWLEHQVFGVHHAVVLGREDEVHVVLRGGDEHQLVAVVGLVVGQHHTVHTGAEGVELHGHQTVAHGEAAHVALRGGVEEAHVLHAALHAGQHRVALGGQAVESRLLGQDAVLHALGLDVGQHHAVVYALALGHLLLRRGHPEHVAHEDAKYQNQSDD